MPAEREVTSNLNNPRVEHNAVADAVVASARNEAGSGGGGAASARPQARGVSDDPRGADAR